MPDRPAAAPPGAPPDPVPSADPRLGRLGFVVFGDDLLADLVLLTAQVGRRRWHPCLWRDSVPGAYAVSLTRDRPARFFPFQTVGEGLTPVAALTDAILRLCDPDHDPDLDAAVERAVRWRLGLRDGRDSPAPPVGRRPAAAAPPPDPDAPVVGVAYRPAEAVAGRTPDGWYPAGEVLDRPAGERLRVWMKPAQYPRVRTQRIGHLDPPNARADPALPAAVARR